MTPLDRLGALDAAFLDLETPRSPLHVGWTMRFEGRPPPLAALRRHLDQRLDRVPRFRRRVASTPAGPAWLDDRGFDVARHVAAVTLGAPGGAEQLRETAGALLGRALDPGRPLWRIYLVDGLRDGGFALIGQVHHALVDGIAAVEVATLLFDAAGHRPAPHQPGTRAADWRPQAAPSPARIGAGAATHVAGEAVRAAAALARRARRPEATVAALREARGGLADVLAPAPPTALEFSLTSERRVAYASAPLDAVREAGRRRGATVNDVLLAACALALGAALRRRGERPAALKALVPVNVRGSGDAAALGNAISFVAVWLPAAERDPTTVLRTVRDSTRAAKDGGAARPLAALTRAGELLPGPGRRALARAAARATSYNAVVSNVPGPPLDLLLLGRRLASIHPAVPLLDGHALSIGALSYAGRLNVGLYADAAVVGDAVEVARDLESAFDALRLAPERPPSAPTPWGERARARRATRAQRAAKR